jgi:hypothetical protein
VAIGERSSRALGAAQAGSPLRANHRQRSQGACNDAKIIRTTVASIDQHVACGESDDADGQITPADTSALEQPCHRVNVGVLNARGEAQHAGATRQGSLCIAPHAVQQCRFALQLP